MKDTVDYYGHRTIGAQTYRDRLVQRWIEWNPALAQESGSIRDLLLPSQKARDALSDCLPPIDVMCLTLVSLTGESSAILVPSGRGKTTVAFKGAGLRVQGNAGVIRLLRSDTGSSFRIFCSDMTWMSVVDRRLCLCRPRGELMIFAWDIARMLARKAIGLRRFEMERRLPLPKRTHASIFRRLVVKPPFRAIVPMDICFPDKIVLATCNVASSRRGIEHMSGSHADVRSFEEALMSQAAAKSKFWHATGDLTIRLKSIVKAITVWPKILNIRWTSPTTALQVISDIADYT